MKKSCIQGDPFFKGDPTTRDKCEICYINAHRQGEVKWMQSWFTKASCGGRVTFLPRTTFLHVNTPSHSAVGAGAAADQSSTKQKIYQITTFLSDEGPTLKTLHFTIRISSKTTFLNFDLIQIGCDIIQLVTTNFANNFLSRFPWIIFHPIFSIFFFCTGREQEAHI